MQSMFEAPSDPDITTVTVTSKSITDARSQYSVLKKIRRFYNKNDEFNSSFFVIN